ncbi:1-aminocyclopropane-1-carboxylate synthase 2 [Zancudomyces culisetae]|uniref:1-aminocyclopropane-1-carboxylate synthase 2 n=1 Tax=Zancudomyces culisetae TaxID=1213189 RepID=A0A1R1PM70_ZANCU|nr:1-aminocyclopropane-1-carboxylate synthase 2 [Zancudomyces culisetae]|eukprot:OMH82029.1 1-aminocyclopropane-1-carboxylate synthase 2 [Zancudomyces culisetae]
MSGEHGLSEISKENIHASQQASETRIEKSVPPYDKATCSNGIIDLAVAVNKLNENEILQFLNKANRIEKHNLDYGSSYGSVKLRTAISGVINRHFMPHHNIVPDDIIVTNGCTAALDLLTSVMCNPGDAILVSAPFYSKFETDMYVKSRGRVYPVYVPVNEVESEDQVKYFEAKITELKKSGEITPKVLVVCNPHNPLGKCYPERTIKALLRFANRHSIYVVMDEIYALSVYRTPEDVSTDKSDNTDVVYPFKSVLSFENLSEIIDPSLVIVLHGLSKDFCMNGLRMGWVVSPFNKNFVIAAKVISKIYFISSTTDSLVTNFLSDTEFIDNFISTNQRRLKENYYKITEYLTRNNVSYVSACAGVYIWVDLRRQLMVWKNKNLRPGQAQVTSVEQLTFDDEGEMWASAINIGRVCIVSGQPFKSTEPGWFRIILAIPWETLELGLDRLLGFLLK